MSFKLLHVNPNVHTIPPVTPTTHMPARFLMTSRINSRLYDGKDLKMGALEGSSHVHRVYYLPPHLGERRMLGACIVHRDEAAACAYFCFRGAQGMGEILDAVSRAVPCPLPQSQSAAPKSTTKLVHAGFLRYFTSLEEAIHKDIEKTVSEQGVRHVVFSGHSMGGSIALIAGAQLAPPQGIQVSCYAYGSPCTGNHAFLRSLPTETIVMRHAYDLIPVVCLHKDLARADGILIGNATGCVESPFDITKVSPVRTAQLLGVQQLLTFHSCTTYAEGAASLANEFR
jgi:hypothetical protein